MATVPGKDPQTSDRRSAPVRVRDDDSDGSDAERFTALYRSHQQRIFDFACRRVGPETALEVVSETFLVAWRKFSDVPEEPVPWLYRVASFEIANLRRRQRRNDELRLAMRLAHGSSCEPESTSGLPAAVAAAFDSLSAPDQEVLRLATWERLTMAEGASVLGCSVSAYRMRLHRARARLGKRVAAKRADAPEDPAAASFTEALADPIARVVNGVEVAL